MDRAKTSEIVRGSIDSVFRIVEMIGVVALLHALTPDGRMRDWIARIGIALITTWFTLPLTLWVGAMLYDWRMRAGSRRFAMLCTAISLICLGLLLQRGMLQLSTAIERHDQDEKS